MLRNFRYIFYSFCFCITFLCADLNAQTILNGAELYSGTNSLIKVNQDSLLIENNAQFHQNGVLVIDKDFYNNSGKTEANGNIKILGNLINNDSIIGISNSSLIELTGNWTNNSTFIPGQNTTILNGTTQFLSGTNNTNFYKLSTLGSLNDKKEIINTSIFILNELDLGDVEFATHTNELGILNPSLTAIKRNNGFVSSEGSGKLSRIVNSTEEYLFPTGSSDIVLRYRPIGIRPKTLNLQTFAVRLANNDPNLDSYSRTNISADLCGVNENFYHKIYGSSEAEISSYFVALEDGDWNANAHWRNNIWNNMEPSVLTNNADFDILKTSNWNNFNSENFVLGLEKPKIIMNDEIQTNFNTVINLNPYYNGPEPYNILWSPEENIDCETCLETDVVVLKEDYYKLSIEVIENCFISDSILILINPDKLNFPTGFSPNEDGVNDYFIPMNKNLNHFNIKVYNRWGEKVFETNDANNGWNGKYKNSKAELGVYTYIVEYNFNGQDKILKHKGTFTLLR